MFGGHGNRKESSGLMNASDEHGVAARVYRHSQRVRHLRLAVPALAAGLALTYALSATPPRVDREFAEQFAGLETTAEGMRLARPRYAGEDLSGRPFELAAVTATRPSDQAELIGLESPLARRRTHSGTAMTVTAREGRYDERTKVMDLTADVEMEQADPSGRFTLRTDAATMDFDTQVIRANTEVRGRGDGGTLRADRGTLYQDEDRLVLEGRVRIDLMPAREPSDGAGVVDPGS